MSQRGLRVYKQRLWEADQRRIGRADARAKRPAQYADASYQRGYREGGMACQCANSTAHPDGCPRVPNGRLCPYCRKGHNN